MSRAAGVPPHLQPLPLLLPRNRAELEALSAEQWQALLAGPPEQLAGWLWAAADLGDARAHAMLGQMFLSGHGVGKDSVQAYAHFSAAAALGDAMAMNMCGRCLEHGWGVAVDDAAAAGRYLHAAQAGLDWGMYNYANLLGVGRGVAQDHAQALAWYRKAAALGHAKSLNLVGRYQEEGLGGLVASRSRAFIYYRAAAEGGDFRGQYSYACMLAERGRIDQAVWWLRQVPRTATSAFLRRAGYELQLSPHGNIREIAQEMLAQCREDAA